MHPALMGKDRGGSISISIEAPEQKQDPIMDMIDGMRSKDLPKCLRALAQCFATESTEYEG